MSAPSRLENLRTLQSANLDAAFATAFATLVTGTILVGLIKYLGGGDYEIGLAAAVPTFVGILQIPGAAWGRSFASFKKFVAPGGLAWRLLYIPLIFLAFMPFPGAAKFGILLLCITVGSAAVQFVTPTYNEWLGELVPERSRGWYFSRRTLICTVAGMAVGPLAGIALDAFKRRGSEGMGFAVLFAVACVLALISMAFYLRMADWQRPAIVPVSLKETWRQVQQPLSDRNFRMILVFSAIFMASQTFAGNLFPAFALESLKMPFTLLQLKDVSNAVGIIVAVKAWGFLSDKYGNKPVIVIGMIGIILTPGMWILCQPGHLAMNATILIIGHFFNGAIWASVAVAQMNLYLATAKPADRANYLATAQAIQAAAGGVAPLLGAAMMHSLRLSLGDPATAYKWVFVSVMAMRVVAMFTLMPVREKGSVSVRGTVRELFQVSPKGMAALRAMRTISDARDREAAVETVGETGLGMATSEVARALQDPSPKVRRKAAEALGRLGTAEAANHILDVLHNHPELCEEEMIEALASAPTVRAVPALIKYLEHPRSALRRAAAKALGSLQDESAVAALSKAAKEPGDTDLRRASLQALRNMEATAVGRTYADALFDPHASVRTAAAEAISDLNLSEYCEDLRKSLEWFGDDDPSEVAYALGCLGTQEDLPLLLSTAKNAVSPTARRRILLGVAHVLEVETQVYHLMTMDPIDRDTALISQTRTFVRRNPAAKEALERFSLGDEAGALRALAEAREMPALDLLAEIPVEDAFLVAATVLMAAAGH